MIYVGQNSFQIVIDTDFNLAGVSSSDVFLRYTSPSLTTGQFAPAITTSTDGILTYTCTSTNTFEAGVWVMWIHATHGDTRVSIGEPFLVTVKSEGDY